jgi:hypothetical protein
VDGHGSLRRPNAVTIQPRSSCALLLISHDHLQPATWADVPTQVPELVVAAAGALLVRLADGQHHVAAIGSKLGVAGVVIDDVLPALDGQLDPSAVGINDMRQDRHVQVRVIGDARRWTICSRSRAIPPGLARMVASASRLSCGRTPTPAQMRHQIQARTLRTGCWMPSRPKTSHPPTTSGPRAGRLHGDGVQVHATTRAPHDDRRSRSGSRFRQDVPSRRQRRRTSLPSASSPATCRDAPGRADRAATPRPCAL